MEQEQLRQLQLEMAQQVEICTTGEGYMPQGDDLYFTMDIQYEGDLAHIAVVVKDFNEHISEVFVQTLPVEVEYVPGFFAFREGPLLKQVIEKIIAETDFYPNLLIIDGHGIAHPRRLGLAAWLGVELGIPAIGCAKRTLLKYDVEKPTTRGAYTLVWQDGEEVGAVLCTQNEVKPVYVSVGHRIALITAINIVLSLATQYRQVEAIRIADQKARQLAKGVTNEVVLLS